MRAATLRFLRFSGCSRNSLSISIRIRACSFFLISSAFVTQAGNDLGVEGVDLIAPFVLELFGQPQSSVHALWTLFAPMTSLMSAEESCDVVLPHLMSVYEQDATKTTTKHMKLYHKSFIVQLMVRLGVGVFLEDISRTTIEACAGFKDFRSDTLVTSQLDADDVMQCSITDVFLNSRQAEEGFDELSPENENGDDDVIDSFSRKMDAESHKSFECDVTSQDVSDQVSHDSLFAADAAEADVGLLSSSVGRCSLHSISRLRAPDAVSGTSDAQSPDEPPIDEIATPATELDNSTGSAFATIGSGEASRSADDSFNIRDVAAETVSWLAQRLGPVITARFLSSNLLRMLSLCYRGEEQQAEVVTSAEVSCLKRALSSTTVRGDDNARKILESLAKVVTLYGEHVIVLQYFAHIDLLVTHCMHILQEHSKC